MNHVAGSYSFLVSSKGTETNLGYGSSAAMPTKWAHLRLVKIHLCENCSSLQESDGIAWCPGILGQPEQLRQNEFFSSSWSPTWESNRLIVMFCLNVWAASFSVSLQSVTLFCKSYRIARAPVSLSLAAQERK